MRELEVRSAYELWSETYDTTDNPMTASVGYALATLKDVSGADVIEFGCGTGRNLEYLCARGAGSLRGLDLSPAMLKLATRRVPSASLLEHDMTVPTPYERQSADLVLFSLTLEHIADLASPLREAARLVRPSGRVLIYELHPFASLHGSAAHFVHDGEVIGMPTHTHLFSDYINASTASGLRLCRSREWFARDFGDAASPEMLKRGPNATLIVELELRTLRVPS